ncbi:MAG: ABC transporter ATP-binding protein [Gemmatimonadota bacterium]
MTVLAVTGLDVPFGAESGLRGITFHVERGERFVLVGASGVGKTSLLQALSGALRPTAGQVLVEGQDVTDWPVERRPSVLLAQTPLLFPHLTVFENVAFPLRVRRVAQADVAGRVEAALAAVRMGDFAARRPATLSGGQARRVALARAVVARPAVLLLDEPLSALDPALREEIRTTILDIHADYRPALVMVTHDLAEAGRIGDRIGVIIDGTLAQASTPAAVFRRPASAAVARFLGLPNELEGVVGDDGVLVVGALRLPCREGARPGLVRVVFGTDAAEIVDPECAGVRSGPAEAPTAFTGSVTRVVHQPEGATAQVETEVGRIEVRVPLDRVPETGSRVGVRLMSDRVHVYDGDPPPNS